MKLSGRTLRRSDPNGYAKRNKDLMQAGLLINTMVCDKRADDVGFAWMEAWKRGMHWRKHLIEAARKLDIKTVHALMLAIGIACVASGEKPENHGYIEIRR